MQELGTDVNLYALVFGESVLNDAVRVILFYFCYFLYISVFHTITGCSQCSSHFFSFSVQNCRWPFLYTGIFLLDCNIAGWLGLD